MVVLAGRRRLVCMVPGVLGGSMSVLAGRMMLIRMVSSVFTGRMIVRRQQDWGSVNACAGLTEREANQGERHQQS